MTIIQITAGAGPMYCGNCLRDNALVAALRKLGHHALLVPLYLPLTLDEPDQSMGTPIFLGGISVYLEQKSALFRAAPRWLHQLLASRRLLQWAAGKAAKTRAADLGELTLSMLRGEAGNQARELSQLSAWLKTQPKPDVICLSNALLLGLVRRLKSDLGAPVVCMLQGEDSFLEGLPESHRARCWQTLAERAAEVDLFVAPSRYFAQLMRERLGLPAERIRVVRNGIDLEGYAEERGNQSLKPKGQAPQAGAAGDSRAGDRAADSSAPAKHDPSPILGYFARMCPEKGLDTLVEAYIALRQANHVPGLKLRIGGSCGPADEPFVKSLRERLQRNGLLGETEFHPNLERADKVNFLRLLTVFSVPAPYGEAFGLYVIEALAAGVPVVQPRSGAFPELIEATGGGLLCEAGDPQALAKAIEELLLNPERARALGAAGRRAACERFSAEAMAQGMTKLFEGLAR